MTLIETTAGTRFTSPDPVEVVREAWLEAKQNETLLELTAPVVALNPLEVTYVMEDTDA